MNEADLAYLNTVLYLQKLKCFEKASICCRGDATGVCPRVGMLCGMLSTLLNLSLTSK